MKKQSTAASALKEKNAQRKACPLRAIPGAVRIQAQSLDNLLDRICSGLVWNG